MSDLILNESQLQQFNALNDFFEKNKKVFTNILNFDNLVNESHVLNSIEASLPEGLNFDLHLDLILNRGVTDYYKSLSSNTNYILEAAQKIFPNDSKITESIESFKKYLGTLYEQSLTLGMPSVNPSDSIESAISGGELRPRTNKGFWSTLKSLWLAVTENGSTLGIIHFIIDIIGLVGDFIFPGVGVVADIINAIIYAIRGEWMLASISLIAAFVIGFGDALKLVKFAAKPAGKVMTTLAKEGGAEAAEKMIAKMPAKEKAGVLQLLTSILGNIGGVLGKATSLLGKFFEGFGKVTRYIPRLGGALNGIFKGLGSTLTEFGDKMAIASANLKLVTKSAKEAAAISIDAALKSGGDFVVDGQWIKVLNKEGKQIGRYPAKQLEKLTGEQLVNLTAKKAGSPEAAKILYKDGNDIAKVNNALTNPKTQDSLRRRAYTYFETTPLKKGARRFMKDLLFFLGKQVYKIIFGTYWVDGANNKWSKEEVMGHGNGALNSWINKKIKEEKNKTGATYVTAIQLDSEDTEAYNRIADYQNHFAKITGQPDVMQAIVTKKYDTEGEASEFKDFFAEIAKGNIKRGGPGDKVAHRLTDTISENQSAQIKLKTILNFSDFKK